MLGLLRYWQRDKMKDLPRTENFPVTVSFVIQQHGVAEPRVNLLLLSIGFLEDGKIGENHYGARNPEGHRRREQSVQWVYLQNTTVTLVCCGKANCNVLHSCYLKCMRILYNTILYMIIYYIRYAY